MIKRRTKKKKKNQSIGERGGYEIVTKSNSNHKNIFNKLKAMTCGKSQVTEPKTCSYDNSFLRIQK